MLKAGSPFFTTKLSHTHEPAWLNFVFFSLLQAGCNISQPGSPAWFLGRLKSPDFRQAGSLAARQAQPSSSLLRLCTPSGASATRRRPDRWTEDVRSRPSVAPASRSLLLGGPCRASCIAPTRDDARPNSSLGSPYALVGCCGYSDTTLSTICSYLHLSVLL